MVQDRVQPPAGKAPDNFLKRSRFEQIRKSCCAEIASRDQNFPHILCGKTSFLTPEDYHDVHNIPAMKIPVGQYFQWTVREGSDFLAGYSEVLYESSLYAINTLTGTPEPVNLFCIPMLTYEPGNLRDTHIEHPHIVITPEEMGSPDAEPGADIPGIG